MIMIRGTSAVLAAALGVMGALAAQPAAAISTVNLSYPDGEVFDVTVTCSLICDGVTGTQTGTDADVGSGEFSPDTASIFHLEKAKDETELGFLRDLIDADDEVSGPDIADSLLLKPETTDKTNLGSVPDSFVFDVEPGFFLVKFGGGKRVAYLYSDFRQQVTYKRNGVSSFGLSHYNEFGGLRFDPPSLEEPPSVPTPAALPLLGAGLAALGLLARRRRR